MTGGKPSTYYLAFLFLQNVHFLDVYVLVPSGLGDFQGLRLLDTRTIRGGLHPPSYVCPEQLLSLRSAKTPEGQLCPQEELLVSIFLDLAREDGHEDVPAIALTTAAPLWSRWGQNLPKRW